MHAQAHKSRILDLLHKLKEPVLKWQIAKKDLLQKRFRSALIHVLDTQQSSQTLIGITINVFVEMLEYHQILKSAPIHVPLIKLLNRIQSCVCNLSVIAVKHSHKIGLCVAQVFAFQINIRIMSMDNMYVYAHIILVSLI